MSVLSVGTLGPDDKGNNKISGNHSELAAGNLKAWQLDLDGKMQECFQRVLEMGGKIAEEAQRRHLAISATRAAMRNEAKRIDEMQAAAKVAEARRRVLRTSVVAKASSMSLELIASLESKIDIMIGERIDTQWIK